MFIDNKYYKWYIKLTSKKDRVLNCYTEKHHVIPRSLGWADGAENIVVLTAREHFIAHLLLSKCTDGSAKKKMSYALWNMVNRDSGARTNSHVYCLIREQHSLFLSENNKGVNNPMFGKEHSEDTKKKISSGGKGLKRSELTCLRISEANKGEKNPMFGIPNTEKQKEASSERLKENNPMRNKEAVNKIKEAKKGTINCFDLTKQKFIRVSSEVYHSDRYRYKNNNSKEAKLFKGVA